MSAIVLSEKFLFDTGGWQATKPARELLRSGRVSEAKYEPPLLTGIVREGGKNYRAGLRIKSTIDVENLCTCYESRSTGKICSHSVAVGLAFLAPPKPEIVKADLALPGPSVVLPNFVAAESVATTTLYFILPPNFPAAWDRGQIMLVVEAEIDGRRTLVSALAKGGTVPVDEHDLSAVHELKEFSGIFASGMITLSRSDFLGLLPSLQNHPRVTFGKSTAVEIATSTFRPLLELKQVNESRITARADLPNNSKALIDNGDAWLLRENEFIRCSEQLTPEAAALLAEPRTFDGDRALHFLALDLPRLREVFDVRGSEGIAIPKVSAATPDFVLRLSGSLNQLTAELMCKYAERSSVVAGANLAEVFVYREADELRTRNLSAEVSAVARLERIGFEPANDARTFALRGQAQVVRFFASEFVRLQDEWKISLSPQVENWSGQLERVTPRFEVVGSGEDWFEVSYSLAAPGGQEFSSAEVQRLLRSGQTQTKLKNGRTGVFDIEGLEDFEEVIRDCDPTQNQPGIYRINRAHAGYLQSTAKDSGAILSDRKEALRNFLGRPDHTAETDFEQKLGSLTKVLREYQHDGVVWLSRLSGNHLGGILADEMGLGKTLQALAFLRVQKGSGAALIVCPTSLVANWESEARKFTPELKSLVLEGADRAKRFAKISQSDVVITSYALLRRDIDELRKVEFSTAVLDEAQHIKNPETQNAQAAYSLRARNRFVLTGTPMENSVRDLWSIMNFTVPGYLGSRADFKERYEQPLARGAAPEVQKRLSRRLQPFLLRRRKRDVAKDLPDKIEQVIPCDLTKVQQNAYDALLREIQHGLGSGSKDVNAGATRMKMLTGLLRLRQVCCDLRLLKLEIPERETSAKLDLLDELLEEAIDGEHRVLIFSQFVSMLHLIRQRLEKLEINFCYLDGQTKKRQEVVNRFQSDATVPVFLISLKAGGVGLNLSAADTVIHFDPWWNPAVEAQATDRAHRIGQTRVVTSYKLITRGTVEEKILKLQEKKRAAIDAAIDSEEPLMSGLTTAELEELLS